MWRIAVPVAAVLLLSACGSAPKPRPDPYAGEPGSRARALHDADATRVDALPPAPNCVPMREHDESLYTAGGLYAPGVATRLARWLVEKAEPGPELDFRRFRAAS